MAEDNEGQEVDYAALLDEITEDHLTFEQRQILQFSAGLGGSEPVSRGDLGRTFAKQVEGKEPTPRTADQIDSILRTAYTRIGRALVEKAVELKRAGVDVQNVPSTEGPTPPQA